MDGLWPSPLTAQGQSVSGVFVLLSLHMLAAARVKWAWLVASTGM